MRGVAVTGVQTCAIPTCEVVIDATYTTFQLDHNLTATASYTVSPSLAGTVTLGNNLNVRDSRQVYVVGNGLIAPQPFKLENTVDRNPPTTTETKIHSVGFFGQGTMDLWSQLYLTAALRRDGSSTFGQNNRWAWFPKADRKSTRLNSSHGYISY